MVPAAESAVPRPIRLRRWWLVPLLVWAGVLVASFQLQGAQIRKQAVEVALEGARNMFHMVLLTRAWNASHGGVYVPVTPATPPNPYLEHERRDVVTTDGVEMTMINPAYMTRLVASMAASEQGAVFRLTSLRPIRPANAPDDWERVALTAFERGEKEVVGVVGEGVARALRFMAPLPVTEPCLACHAKQGYKVGEVRGGISVSQAYAPIERAVQAAVQRAALVHGLIFVVVAALGWLLLEMLRRRWLELVGTVGALESAQSRLLQAEKMASVGQLAAGVAHEINNPVGFVRSNLGTLGNYARSLLALAERCRDGKAGEADFVAADLDYLREDVTDLLQESNAGLERVTRIVANLRGFAHVDEAAWQTTDINAAIETTLALAAHAFAERIAVVRALGEVPPVPCIAAQVNQVILSLVANAEQAMEGQGTLTVRSGADAADVWFEIADTGCGMSDEVRARLFEPFFTTRAVGQGTGLGLSLAWDIVTAHGGRIDVDSTPGKGSVFRVWLPRSAPGQPQA